MTKMTVGVAEIAGVTVSVKDYYNSDAINKELNTIIDGKEEGRRASRSTSRRSSNQLPGYTRKETFEMEVMAELESARTLAAGAEEERRHRQQHQLMAWSRQEETY